MIANARLSATAPACALIVALLATACARDPIVPPLVCPAGQAGCGEGCIDVTADPANCGGCGIPCATGQLCAAGVCACAPGTRDCNGTCVPADAEEDVRCGAATATPTLVTSTRDSYWMTGTTLTPVTAGAADVTVDDTSTAQTWEGFGGAFNELGWTALASLSPDLRDAALRLLYGGDGARFTFGRIPIGASDYATERYTLAEGADATALASFSIARDTERLIPYVKAAQAVKGNIRFWASPWTPPTWMKQGPFSAGKVPSPFDGGSMKSDDATLAAFAQYLTAFVQAYAAQGITIEAVAPQNEPNYTGTYPTCAWSPSTYTKLIGQHLGPALADAGLPTKVMLGTLNGGGSDRAIFGAVMDDVAARAQVKVFGFQWGMVDTVAAARRYNLPVWQSEHRCGNYPWQPSFDATRAPNDHAYAVESWGLIRDWIRAGVTAYSAWNMVLDTGGVGIDTTRVWPQNALLAVDTTARTLTITPTYYVFRHLSQFVATGAKVVAARGGDALAFKNPDGSIVAVLRNGGAARTMIVSAAGQKVQFAMPADGWATVVVR